MNAPDKNTRFFEGDSVNPADVPPQERPFFRRRRVIFAAGAAFIVLLTWALWPGSKTHVSGSRDANAPVPVGVAAVRRSDIRVTLDELGTVTPLATVVVKPEVSGILQRIAFQEGQMVRAGDVLAIIDPRPYQAALDQAKGSLARDEAQLANAKVDLARYQTLWSQNAISQQSVATQQALVRTDAGTVEADRAAVEAAAVNLGFCKIVSPVAGRVGLRQVDLGNYVQVGVTTGIVAVTELQPISVLFTVPEDNLPALSQRVQSGAQIPVDAYDRAQVAKLASGHLSNIDNEVDPATGTVKMRALFDNNDGHLFPQQFVNVRILVNTLHGRTTISVAAVQHGASGDFVFLTEPNKTVTMRSVGLGVVDGDMVDVKRGLSPGDVVVVDGADQLRDGSRVVIGGASPSGNGAGKYGGGMHHRHHHAQSAGDGDGG